MNAAAPFVWTEVSVRRALGLDDETQTRPRAGASRENQPAQPRRFTGISTDTRALRPGDLFVALRGPRFDGHRFLAEAVAAGAAGAVGEEGVSLDLPGAGTGEAEGLGETAPLLLYRVPDTLVALGQLGRFRRRAFAGPVVGLTGSSGKTTVKEMIRAALATRYRVHATPANQNNRIGVPLTLLAIPHDAEMGVVEMGTNEAGEIATLTRITEPDVGLVITVSETHLEGLGSLEGVLEEKLSLVVHLRPEARAFVGDSPPELPRAARRLRDDLHVVGLSSDADPEYRGRAQDMDADGRMAFRLGDLSVRPGYPGRHGAANALLALVVARELGVSPEQAVPALEALMPAGLRGERRRIGAMELVLDCYNANPQSVRAALDTLSSRRWPAPRVAILGSMLELGAQEASLHREILGYALDSGVERLVAVGAFAEAAQAIPDPVREGVELIPVPEPVQVPERLFPLLRGDELVLLKGSRGIRLETLVPAFEAVFAGETGEAAETSSAPAEYAEEPTGASREEEV